MMAITSPAANVAEAVYQSGMLFRAKTPWVLAVPTFFDEQPSRSGKAHSADTPYMPEPKSPTLGRGGWPQPISVWVVRGGW